MTPTLPVGQPLPFRILLDEGVRLSRRHFRGIYPAVAVPLAAMGGTMALVQGIWFGSMAAGGPGQSRGLVLAGMAGFLLSVFAFLVVYALGYAALLTATVDATATRRLSMARAWRFAASLPVLGTNLLATVVIAAGFICCILPGVYLALLFSMTVPVMAEEGLFGTAAMRRSAELAAYNPQRSLEADPRLKVFVILFVGTLLGYALNLVIEVPLIVVQQLIVFRDAASGQPADPAALMAQMTWFQVPAQVLSMMTNTAVQLYVCFTLALLFFDLKRRKEGMDLEAAIARLAEPRLPSA